MDTIGAATQLPLPLPSQASKEEARGDYREELAHLLRGNLNFQGASGAYASHNFHAFPAKFPPQLPAIFIERLTHPGDLVLDPMMGSGTTLVEAILAQRSALGADIDPLALIIARTKTTPLNPYGVSKTGHELLIRARRLLEQSPQSLEKRKSAWTKKTQQFVDYWFASETQQELLALSASIEAVNDASLRRFFHLLFSSVIITKSGGVSLARDLAHTRPHRAKIIYDASGVLLEGQNYLQQGGPRIDHISKRLSSPLEEFEKRLLRVMPGVKHLAHLDRPRTFLIRGNAQSLPLRSDLVDLIVTSPPYASNAIDYMRAHKFSLVWFGYSIEHLSEARKRYVGGESIRDVHFEPLPPRTAEVVHRLAALDKRKGQVLHRYYSEMMRILREMRRVLKPGKAAIVVVGSSVMRGMDTETGACLGEIGEAVGFRLAGIGVREIDRDKRMMPTGAQVNAQSQIQKRMHQEFVIGFLK